MKALCKPSSGAPGLVAAILEDEKRQKVDKFKPVYLGKYRYGWKKVCW